MKNAFTVDVEDWYQTLDFDFDISQWERFEDRVVKNTHTVLNLLERNNTKATFYVLGCIAKKHPELVKEIAAGGHEIGSHGMWHTMVTRQTREEFRADIKEAKQVLEDITGAEIGLYRSSSWSIQERTLWALEILEEEGYVCDSSIQPFRTPLSGMRKVLCEPFHPVVNGKTLKLVEFPPTVGKLGPMTFPFAGGLYLRVIPYFLIKRFLNKVNQLRPGMVYTHPWELDPQQPRLKVPLHIQGTHYYHLEKTEGKLEQLLKDYQFMPLGELIKNKEYPVYQLD